MKTILVILFSFIGAAAQTGVPSSLDYKIKPISLADRVNLEISVSYKTDNAEIVKLPPGCYGTPNLYKYVTKFDGQHGTKVLNGDTPSEKIVTPNRHGKVSIRYTLSFNPKIIENSAFAPKIDPKFFSIAGCQWLLRIGDDELKRRVFIEIVDAPKDWKVHSSISGISRKIKTNASYSELLSSRIGGGGASYTFFIKNKPVSVFVKGNFQIPNQKIFDAVEKIVRVQRDWFRDYKQPFYQVVVNARKNVVAGTSIKNQVVCFVKRDVDEVSLNMILAHEMFHNWLPQKMSITRPKGDRQVRHEWFFEGFTEYFAKKVLFDSKLLSRKQFAELINKDIHSLADNPHKNIRYKRLLSLAKARKFTSTHKKLSYFRGVLIALKWETQLRNSNRNLSAFTQKLYRFISRKGGKISEDEFFNFAKNQGIDAKGDFEKYILNGNPIVLSQNALGTSFIGTRKPVPTFNPGFSVRESRKMKKIMGVEEKSAAYRAGLRNGMDLIRIRNSSRFSNAWRADAPLTVVVKIDGKEKKIAYFPHGDSIQLLQFQPKK